MHSRAARLLLGLMCLTSYSLLQAYASTLTQDQILTAKRIPPMPKETPQGLEGGFWRTDERFNPILHLKNVLLKQALDVTPELYFADGTEYDLPAVHLEPAGVNSVDIRAALEAVDVPEGIKPHISTYGMVGISYQWSWAAVLASIQDTDEITSLSGASAPLGTKSVVHNTPEVTTPQIVRSSWWRATPHADEVIALGNTSLITKHVEIRVSDARGSLIARRLLELGSHQSTVLRVNDLLSGNVDPGVAGDLTIVYVGAAHAIAASASIEDTVTGFSFTPHMVEQTVDSAEKSHAVTLHAPGLMLGRADTTMGFAPGTTFTPYAVLHNVSNQALTATLSLATEGADGTPSTRALDTLSLEAGATISVDMSRYFTSNTPLPDGFGHLSLAYTGKRGDLLFDAGSVDQSKNYVFPVIPSVEAPTTSKVLCFWQIDDNTSTMISVWNYADSSQDATLTLYYNGGGKYRLPIHLAPRQAYNLDLMELLHNRVPDADGKFLPDDVGSGSAMLVGPGGELSRMTIVVSASTYSVHSATCWPICTSCGGVISVQVPNYTVAAEHTVQATATVLTAYGTEYMTSGDWTVANPNIANISSGGTVGGLEAGATTISFITYAPAGAVMCYYSAQEMCQSQFWGGDGWVSVTPFINSISPSTIPINGSDVQVTISGAGFGTSPIVNLPNGVAKDSQTASDNQIVITLYAANNATVGPATLSVTSVSQTSNNQQVVLDGPYQIAVITDTWGRCSGCQSTIERDINYQIKNYSGSNAGASTVCEQPSLSNWSCTSGNSTPSSRRCGVNPFDSYSGTFVDGWTMGSDAFAPPGCGYQSVSDPWYWAYTTTPTPIGRPAGSLLTNAITIDGVTTPSTLTPGTVIPK